MRNGKRLFSLVVLSLAVGLGVGCQWGKGGDKIKVSSYTELEEYFKSMGFTYEAWHSGMRSVPRAYIVEIPEKWRDIAAEVSIAKKKQLFFSSVLPLVLRANELIWEERKKAEALVMKMMGENGLSPEDKEWLKACGIRYRVLNEGALFTRESGQELLMRLDLVPPSLVLAQAAYESAYATSRFAGLGNALFGQWTYKGDGIRPKKQRTHLGDYKVAAFETPLASTLAYLFNLNTNKAYQSFREKRAYFRRSGKTPDALVLAGTLIRYSERGEDYTASIQKVIRQNGLEEADQAFLRDMKPILIVPVRP